MNEIASSGINAAMAIKKMITDIAKQPNAAGFAQLLLGGCGDSFVFIGLSFFVSDLIAVHALLRSALALKVKAVSAQDAIRRSIASGSQLVAIADGPRSNMSVIEASLACSASSSFPHCHRPRAKAMAVEAQLMEDAIIIHCVIRLRL